MCGLKHVDFRGHPSCARHSTIGLPCGRGRIIGFDVCRSHGGNRNTLRHRRALAEREMQTTIADVEVKPLGDPIDRMADLAAQQIAWKDHLASVVANLNDRYRFTDDKGAEQLDARVELYTRAMKESQRQLDSLIKVGFEEQRLRLEERRAQLVADFAVLLIRGLGHDPEEPAVRSQLERLLPMLDGEPMPGALDATADEDEDEDEDE
jgi:hypothetical protein